MAQRKSYGAQPKKVIIPEDRSREGLWVWEVQLTDLLPADKVLRSIALYIPTFAV